MNQLDKHYQGIGESADRSDEDSSRAAVAVLDVKEDFSQPRPDRISPGRLCSRRPRPPKLYRIGEVVEYSRMSRQTIHNYTTMGLLHESRWTTGGHRLYDESVFERLDLIADMKAGNKSLQNIREFFARYDVS